MWLIGNRRGVCPNVGQIANLSYTLPPNMGAYHGKSQRAVDVLTALNAGMIERDAAEQLDAKRAAAQGRVLYGFNVGDYHRLHSAFLTEGRSHAGIILARQQHYSVGEQMRRILKLIATRSSEEMKNQIEFLSNWG